MSSPSERSLNVDINSQQTKFKENEHLLPSVQRRSSKGVIVEHTLLKKVALGSNAFEPPKVKILSSNINTSGMSNISENDQEKNILEDKAIVGTSKEGNSQIYNSSETE
jgi:hypothetical protein